MPSAEARTTGLSRFFSCKPHKVLTLPVALLFSFLCCTATNQQWITFFRGGAGSIAVTVSCQSFKRIKEVLGTFGNVGLSCRRWMCSILELRTTGFLGLFTTTKLSKAWHDGFSRPSPELLIPSCRLPMYSCAFSLSLSSGSCAWFLVPHLFLSFSLPHWFLTPIMWLFMQRKAKQKKKSGNSGQSGNKKKGGGTHVDL